MEPVQGKTCDVAADGYLAEASRLCRKAGALLVADEVQCGLGRTGKWFAFQHWLRVEPDIVCVAKALSGGYVPVGAVITSPRIMDSVFDSMEHCVVHSNTFGQNDLAMASALATLQVMEEDQLRIMQRLGEITINAADRNRPLLLASFLKFCRRGLMFRYRLPPLRTNRLKLRDARILLNRRLRPDCDRAADARAPHTRAGGRLSHPN